MKKFKYLFANGCSFTLGSCMYDVETFIDQTEKREKNRFSKKLADKLNLEEINISTGGSSII